MAYRKIFFILIFFFIASCTLPDGWSDWRARPYWGMKNLPPADTEYGRGFEHGCRHGLYVASKGYLAEDLKRSSSLNTEELINNEQFSLGYYDGYEQCVYIQDWDVV
ncbi:hypothetical protein N8772_03530 [Rickettsiales bacterium]|nr:hypothetical protein [Rickettsiales bacterium]